MAQTGADALSSAPYPLFEINTRLPAKELPRPTVVERNGRPRPPTLAEIERRYFAGEQGRCTLVEFFKAGPTATADVNGPVAAPLKRQEMSLDNIGNVDVVALLPLGGTNDYPSSL